MPEPALREALLNAIVHKDYSSGTPIQISVYPDKLMIWNKGQLPDNWTVTRLKTKHPSDPYNPDIANSFFRAGLIEAWGRGTIKILDECKKAKVAIPSFKYDLSSFIIEFKYKALLQPVLSNNKKTENSIADKVMFHIANNKSITIPELARLIGIAEITVKRILNNLQKENKVIRKGSKKSGTWEVKI
jgi:ATP-dependent DNA helicase RecG